MRFLLVTIVLFSTTSCSHSSEPVNFNPNDLRTWSGTIYRKHLELLPVNQRRSRIGFIGDGPTWNRFWTAWQSTDTPKLDFTNEIVVFIKNTRYVNPIRLIAAHLDKGLLTLTTKEARTARPIRDRLYCAMIVVGRKDVERLTDGKAIVVITSNNN